MSSIEDNIPFLELNFKTKIEDNTDFLVLEFSSVDSGYSPPPLTESIVATIGCLPLQHSPESFVFECQDQFFSSSDYVFQVCWYVPPPLTESIVACIDFEIGNSEYFQPSFFTGETGLFDLELNRQFIFNNETGEWVSIADIEVPSPTNFEIVLSSGETTELETFETTSGINPDFKTGETIEYELETRDPIDILGEKVLLDEKIIEIWNGEDIVTIGDISPYGDGCLVDFPNYDHLADALDLVNSGTLIFVAPGQYHNRILNFTKDALVIGLGANATEVEFRFNGNNFFRINTSNVNLYFENITSRCSTSWMSVIWSPEGIENTHAIFNKCFLHATDSTHGIQLNHSSYPIEFYNCRFTEGFTHFGRVNASQIKLEKCEFDKVPTFWQSNNSLIDPDYVITPTVGYGYNYGSNFALQICETSKSFEVGEILELVNLSTEIVFDSEFATGEYGDADLFVPPFEEFEFENYTGETVADLFLESSITLYLEPATGETFDFDLELFPSEDIPFDFYTGESFEFNLAVELSFPFDFSTGEIAELELFDAPGEELEFEFGSGEVADFVLSTTISFDFGSDSGEILDADFTQNLPKQFPIEFPTGEVATTETNTQWVSLGVPIWTGETGTIQLDSNPNPEFNLPGYTGENLELDFNLSANVGSKHYTGETAYITHIDTDELIKFFTGETAYGELATESTFDLFFYTGETVFNDLSERPAENIGLFRGFSGETAQFQEFNTQEAVYLYPNTIRVAPFVRCNIDSSTDFDLTTDPCCPDFWHNDNSGKYLDLGLNPHPTDHYASDNKYYFYLGLQTQPRFTFQFHTGEFASLEDYDIYFSFNFHTGETLNGALYPEYNINLCRGNFIPNANNAILELLYTYPDCYADYIYIGETLELGVLEANVGIESRMYTGETMFFNFVTDTPWLFRAWSGETLFYPSEAIFEFSFWSGESVTTRFYAEPIQGYTGETMEMDITIQNDVEFLEQGCLTNEFIPLDENGDPIWEEYREVAVELDEYFRWVKARCF